MPARCTITVLEGSRAGAVQTFDLRKTPKITLGTDPLCEIFLPADQHPGVGRRHVSLVWEAEPGTLTLLDASVEGSFVDGCRALEQRLPRESILTLGKAGVTLKITWKRESGLHSTSPKGSGSKAAPEPEVATEPTERRHMLPLAWLVGATAIISVGMWWWQHASASNVGADAVEVTVGRRLAEAKRDFEQRMSGEMAAVNQRLAAAKREMQGGLVEVDATAASAQTRAREAEQKAANWKGDGEAFAEVARKCEHAVALVTGGGGSATAFAIGPQVFATNSHVSMPVAEALAKGEPCWLVLNKSGGNRLRIIRAEVHPRYEKDSRRTGIGYDVGLLFTSAPVTAWLPIAADDALTKLDAGHPVCYIGFPSEGLSGGNLDDDDPVATMKTGILTAVSGWNLRDEGVQGNLLLRHDMGSAGGASGSPILDRNGFVIGIHNAGNYFFSKDAPRMPNAANINFAQRIDCLKALWPDYPKA